MLKVISSIRFSPPKTTHKYAGYCKMQYSLHMLFIVWWCDRLGVVKWKELGRNSMDKFKVNTQNSWIPPNRLRKHNNSPLLCKVSPAPPNVMVQQYISCVLYAPIVCVFYFEAWCRTGFDSLRIDHVAGISGIALYEKMSSYSLSWVV